MHKNLLMEQKTFIFCIETDIKTKKEVFMNKVTKKILVFGLLAYSANTLAVETVAKPFSFEFETTTDEYQFDVSIEQNCRYEIPVWGDSAKYDTRFQSTPLKLTKKKLRDGKVQYKYSLDKTVKLAVTGMFKSGKECTTGLRIIANSSKYALGWANQFHRPVSFTFLDDMYDYEDYDATFEPSQDKNFQKFANNEISFQFKSYPQGNQVNVWIMSNGKKMPSAFPIGVLKNPKTNLPYPLKK